MAGYGVTFFIVCQALNQIIDVYGENHPFLDHCKTIILYAPGSLKDARTFSESIGNRSVLLDNISASGNKFQVGFNNISRSSQETSTSLINPDELMKLEFSRAIIMNQGMPPYKGKKVVYYEDPRFKTKAFMPVPDFKLIMNDLKKLPSNRTAKRTSTDNKAETKVNSESSKPDLLLNTTLAPKESIQEAISKVEAIDVIRVIPADYDVFAED